MTARPDTPAPDTPGTPDNPPPQGGRKAPTSAATPATPPTRHPCRTPGENAPAQAPPRNAYERRQRVIQDKRKAQARAAYIRRMERKADQAERKRQHMQDAADHERELDAPQD